MIKALFSTTILAASSWAASPRAPVQTPPRALPQAFQPAQIQRAKTFVEAAEKRLDELGTDAGFASWVMATNITYDTERLAAKASLAYVTEAAKLARQARRFDGQPLPPDLARKLLSLKLSVTAPAPLDPSEAKELTDVQQWLESAYSKGKHCPTPETCVDLTEIEDRLRLTRDEQELRELWTGWHAVGAPMKEKYARFVELSNKGARDLGFKDTGEMWRAGYDMPPAEFQKELDRLWLQMEPLYLSLHRYARKKLLEKYGAGVVGDDGLIPVHLTGNMWAQEWNSLSPLLAPKKADKGYDLTKLLRDKKTTEVGMVKTAEAFFSSLGFEPLPKTFWERSQLTKPRDREVVCHASAWDVEDSKDIRIKMCMRVHEEDFVTIHHELGHNYYQRAYGGQPYFFQGSANDGFHEAVGDTIALSITPEYLKQIGLLDKVPGPEGDTSLLLDQALGKVAFMPFGLLMDQWRWGVFSGEITPENYNKAWWDLRKKYQRVKPPVERGEEFFDPGAKYHIPANTPYARYFLATVLQFDFYRALCRQSGHQGPLHRCSFYGDKQAGAKLQKMMEMGASRPWPEALEAVTGKREMDATAVLEYFAPLKDWLDKQ